MACLLPKFIPTAIFVKEGRTKQSLLYILKNQVSGDRWSKLD